MTTPNKRATIADLIQAAEIVSALDYHSTSSGNTTPKHKEIKTLSTHSDDFKHSKSCDKSLSDHADYMSLSTTQNSSSQIVRKMSAPVNMNLFISNSNQNETSVCSENLNLCKNGGLLIESLSKPSYSYAQLIIQAIASSDTGKLTLNNIYNYISKTYKFFDMSDKGWQNSIRHNLSLNKYFVKLARRNDESGKGSFWILELSKRDELIAQAFKKRRQRNVPIFTMHNSLNMQNNQVIGSQFPQSQMLEHSFIPHNYDPNKIEETYNSIHNYFNHETQLHCNCNSNSNLEVFHPNQTIMTRERRSQTYSYITSHEKLSPCSPVSYTPSNINSQYICHQPINNRYGSFHPPSHNTPNTVCYCRRYMRDNVEPYQQSNNPKFHSHFGYQPTQSYNNSNCSYEHSYNQYYNQYYDQFGNKTL